MSSAAVQTLANSLCQLHAEVEARECPDLLQQPVLISRSDDECCLIEPSINAVRVSLRLQAVRSPFEQQHADMLLACEGCVLACCATCRATRLSLS